ncbi:hypothetical protein GCM10010172_11570 [Paractinoplanes ferrugineus]|uniref:Uncharacterized protein n=1 Tax=Paractinoplanes ferrugineus TaxID=113564 RepID=A0A919M7S3_9ACTN|nr:hypothetical protein [Actinoplanes ferrugineus]GIE09721.1 hypothetical protein Afe05nite_15610 [Actinoplanes ferrugineus]
MAWRPVVALLVVSPFMGEVLSTATSPLELLVPWNLLLFVALYGCGALLCREVAYRWRLGLPGLILLGAAYGVFEEALVDRFWFDRSYARTAGVGDYSRVWDVSVLLATHLTAFHAAVSVCASVLIVTWLFPGDRERPWTRPWTLPVAGAAMLTVLFVTYDQYVHPPPGPILAAVAVGVLFVLGAWLSGRPHVVRRSGRPRSGRPRPRLLGSLAFVCTAAHFVLVYTLPVTGLAWAIGVAGTLVPLLGGFLAVRRWATTDALGADGLAVVTGVVGFFVLLDLLVGLGGRYDLSVGALLTAAGLVWLRRRVGKA